MKKANTNADNMKPLGAHALDKVRGGTNGKKKAGDHMGGYNFVNFMVEVERINAD